MKILVTGAGGQVGTELVGALAPHEVIACTHADLDAGDRDWSGSGGVVPGLISQADFDPAAATAFVAGPEVMMRFTVRALLEAGLTLHDSSQGGVCLMPELGAGGVVVSWRAHDRMSVHDLRGAAATDTVQQSMNVAMAGTVLLYEAARQRRTGS